MIHARLVPDAQEGLTPGDAMAGMILNGVGFAPRPLSLTPQLFASQPLAWWFRQGLEAEMFNRFTRGRTLDEGPAYGCDLLGHALALALGAHEGIDRRCTHLDTTSVALRGAYVPEGAEHALTITHGDARDHRPDVKPAVLDLRVSHAGGLPVGSKRWDGHTSDRAMFQARTQALMTAFTHAPSPRSLMADAQLSHADHAPTLHARGLITRIPHTIGPVSQVITPALTGDPWHPRDETTRDQRLALCHEGMAQRWLVGPSQAALARAETTVNHARQRAYEPIATPLFHRQATGFPTPEAAHGALGPLAQGWKDHQLDARRLTAHPRDPGKGRPTPKTPRKALAWHLDAPVRPEAEALRRQTPGTAGCVLGTNICASQLRATEVMAAATGHARVEGGCRLLQEPLFCVSSLCVKQPSRLQGLLLVMTCALLVSAVAQRRWRQPLAPHHQTVPNHLNPPTTSPTVRGVFQLLEGMHRVRVRR
jgi:transposase